MEGQAFAASIGTLGGIKGAYEESNGHRSGHGTKGMPSGMGVVHRDMPLMVFIKWYPYKLMPMPPQMGSRSDIHLIRHIYRWIVHMVREALRPV